jgi:hypothetical protein
MSEANQRPDGQFRGRIQQTGPGGRPPVHDGAWGWSDVVDRPRLPWFGVFLVIFGGLLILEQLVPGSRIIGSALVVAVGVALLVAWAVNRHVWQLYAGAVLTALSLPSLLQDANVIDDGQGWGTFFLGVAFLAIALFRWASRAGFGWQLVVGAVLAVIGGAQIAEREIPSFPSLERLAWPALILVVGVILVLRSMGSRRSPGA